MAKRRSKNGVVEDADYLDIITQDTAVRRNDHRADDLPVIEDEAVDAPFARKTDEERYPDSATFEPSADEADEEEADAGDGEQPADENAG